MNTNILNKILLATLPFMAINANAATPQSFNYQSVVRSTSGSLIANQVVYIKVEILKDYHGLTEMVYSEMHNAKTNANGSFAIRIGEGAAQSGKFSEIDWSKSNYAVRTTTSTNAELTDAAVAVSMISSVPYALYSLKSADSFSGRWVDLTGKPEMSEYAKIEDVARYAADSTRKILLNYATTDDVLDLHNRGLRSSNYRVDSLKSIVNSNSYWISELQTNADKYATKAEFSSFIKRDTLASFATKANLNALSKTTNDAIAELNQTINANKALTDATMKDMREVHKLYAKRDTMQYFMSKAAMSDYATNEDINGIQNSLNAITQTVKTTNTRLNDLTNTVSDLSGTVTNNQKAANSKIDSVKTELSKVDDKIASSERKAKADDLVLSNRISANENDIKGLKSTDLTLDKKISDEVSSLSKQITSVNKTNSTAIDSVAKAMNSYMTSSERKSKKLLDSLATVLRGDIETLDGKIGNDIANEIGDVNIELSNIYEMLDSHVTTIASNASSVSSLNAQVNLLTTWANKINAKNDSLSKELTAQKTKYVADSLKMENRIKADSLKADAKYREFKATINKYETEIGTYKTAFELLLAKFSDENINNLIETKVAAAMSTAGVSDLSTKVSSLESDIANLKKTDETMSPIFVAGDDSKEDYSLMGSPLLYWYVVNSRPADVEIEDAIVNYVVKYYGTEIKAKDDTMVAVTIENLKANGYLKVKEE